jgi:hypothetical protein
MESSPYLPGPPGSRSKLFAELIVKMGAGVTSVGATAASGEPLAGAGAGLGVDLVGKKLLQALFHRGEERAWRTVQHAAQRLKERIDDGAQLRADGFDNDDQAIQTIEAMVRAATNSTERRKESLIGGLMASAPLEEGTPTADLLRFLRLLEDLSWRQIVSLSYFMDDDRQSDRAFIAAGGSKRVRQIRPVLEAELADLMEVHGLIGFITSDGSVAKSSAITAGGPIIAASLDKVGPSGFGRTLYRLSEMEREIEAEDLDEFVRAEIL